jgi:hypothetical protein
VNDGVTVESAPIALSTEPSMEDNIIVHTLQANESEKVGIVDGENASVSETTDDDAMMDDNDNVEDDIDEEMDLEH